MTQLVEVEDYYESILVNVSVPRNAANVQLTTDQERMGMLQQAVQRYFEDDRFRMVITALVGHWRNDGHIVILERRPEQQGEFTIYRDGQTGTARKEEKR